MDNMRIHVLKTAVSTAVWRQRVFPVYFNSVSKMYDEKMRISWTVKSYMFFSLKTLAQKNSVECPLSSASPHYTLKVTPSCIHSRFAVHKTFTVFISLTTWLHVSAWTAVKLFSCSKQWFVSSPIFNA